MALLNEITPRFGLPGFLQSNNGPVYTLLFLKWMTNKVLLYSIRNSAQYYVSAWMGGEFWGEKIHAYV